MCLSVNHPFSKILMSVSLKIFCCLHFCFWTMLLFSQLLPGWQWLEHEICDLTQEYCAFTLIFASVYSKSICCIDLQSSLSDWDYFTFIDLNFTSFRKLITSSYLSSFRTGDVLDFKMVCSTLSIISLWRSILLVCLEQTEN